MGHVAQSDIIGVADRSVRQRDIKRVAHGRDRHVDLAPHKQGHSQTDTDARPQDRVNNRARTKDVFPHRNFFISSALVLFIGQGHIVNQTALFADLGHHIIAGINAQRAGDAFQLLTIADIDPDRADIHAGITVDAIAQLICAFCLAMLTTRLAAPIAISDRDCMLVHHRGLNTGPRAHVDTDLLTHETAKHKGCRGQNGDGCIGNDMGLPCQQIAKQGRCIGEIEHPSPPRCDRNRQPNRPFKQPEPDFARIPFGIPQTHACVAIALNPPLNSEEQIRPDRLRAGIAAPNPTKGGGKEEQPQSRHDQKARHEIKFMGPDLDPEEEKTAVGQVDQNRLIGQGGATIKAYPWRDIINRQGDSHNHPFQIAEIAFHTAGKDRLTRSI